MQWGVYLIWCADGSLYCGISNHAAKRWRAHQKGQAARYTRMRGVVEMRIVACCLTHSQALQWEYALKQKTRRQKLAYWAAGCPVA